MREQTEKTTFSCKDDQCKTLHFNGVGARVLYIDEAHTALDIFRFAAFFLLKKVWLRNTLPTYDLDICSFFSSGISPIKRMNVCTILTLTKSSPMLLSGTFPASYRPHFGSQLYIYSTLLYFPLQRPSDIINKTKVFSVQLG